MTTPHGPERTVRGIYPFGAAAEERSLRFSVSLGRLAVGLASIVLALGCAAAARAGAGDGYSAAAFDATAVPEFEAEGGASPFRTTKTVPYWQGSFTDQTTGATYPYTMVGGDPAKAKSTTVPTSIVPFRLVFADGTVMDATGDVQKVLASPIFTAYAHPLSLNDTTQTGDAFLRAMWNTVGTGYHVLLGQPTVYAAQTVNVPANQGFAFVNARGVLVGMLDAAWFSNRVKNTLNDLHVSPTTLPLLVSHNAVLYEGDPSVCCVLGYHSAALASNGNGDQAVQTAVFAAYLTPRIFSGFPNPGRGVADIHGFSHEIAEWLTDPFVNNQVAPWSAPGYGCQNVLETGDPLVGSWFALPGNTYDAGGDGSWHPQDEAYLSWFAHQSPSASLFGRYTYANTFASYATGC